MGMDILRCKSPEMVRKEIWACLLAYHLIRQTMLNAALRYKHSTLRAVGAMIEQQLLGLCWPLVGKRPGRAAPRKVNRRPQPLGYLTVPRAEARAALQSNGAAEDEERGKARAA